MNYNLRFTEQRGVTLLEMLIVFGILTVLASFGFLAYFGYQRAAELNANTRVAIDYLRQAQVNSQAGSDFKTWGILFTNPTGSGGDKLEFYSCSAACNASGDCGGTRTIKEVYTLSSGVSFTTPADNATKDICFDKRTGKMQGTDENIVLSGVTATSTVTISTNGRIQ